MIIPTLTCKARTTIPQPVAALNRIQFGIMADDPIGIFAKRDSLADTEAYAGL